MTLRNSKILTMLGAFAVFAIAFSVMSPSSALAEDPILHVPGEPIIIMEHEHEVEVEHGTSHDGTGHHADGHHDEVDGLPQLDFTTYPSQIFWLFILFTIMYVIFAKKNLPEISSTIENRREQIQDDLDNAGRLKTEAEEVQVAYEAILSKAREDSTDAFKAAEDKIKAKTAKKIDAFNERSATATREKEAEVQKAQKKAVGDMQNIAAEVASLAAEKIVGVSTDLDQAKTLVKNIDKKAA
jgi:F-type H+-transporting ATPase subunit b